MILAQYARTSAKADGRILEVFRIPMTLISLRFNCDDLTANLRGLEQLCTAECLLQGDFICDRRTKTKSL